MVVNYRLANIFYALHWFQGLKISEKGLAEHALQASTDVTAMQILSLDRRCTQEEFECYGL